MESCKLGKYPSLFYAYLPVSRQLSLSCMDRNRFWRKAWCRILPILSKPIRRKCEYLSDRYLSRRFRYFDIIYATTDSIGIDLCQIKSQGLLADQIVIVNAMALFEKEQIKIESIINTHLSYADAIITFSHPVKQALVTRGLNNVEFVRLGTDTEFYSPFYKHKIKKINKPVILGIGLDQKRDWELFRQIALSCREYHFKIIANNEIKGMFDSIDNVEFLGNIPFLETRYELLGSDAVFLPTQNNIYFSGQTTFLNATSMGIPVVMKYGDYCIGYDFKYDYFYKNNSIPDIIEKLNLAIFERNETIINYNMDYVRAFCSIQKMADSLIRIFTKQARIKRARSLDFRRNHSGAGHFKGVSNNVLLGIGG